jgi:FtsZ-binding cell division protein ZapB
MKSRVMIPPIPEAERTPLVVALLGVIEGLAQQV